MIKELSGPRLTLSNPRQAIAMTLFMAFTVLLAHQGTPAGSAAPLIRAGPMVGHGGHGSARVWLRVAPDSVINAAARQGDESYWPSGMVDQRDGFHIVEFSGLKPDTLCTVSLTVSRDDEPVDRAEVTFETAPKPSQSGKVRIAFGSCSKVSQYNSGPIYKAIAEAAPAMALFLGDNSYFIVGDGSERHFSTTGPIGDWNFPESMLARHLRTRVHPDLQAMLRSVPCYAVWDDHDYGPNNADREFARKEAATRVFKQVWANPSYGTEEVGGIFSSFRHGPVEVFLMDDRSHKYSPARHDDVTRQTGKIWGKGQVDWLLSGLKRSTAPVKVIANGTQFLTRTESGEGHFQEAQGEKRRIINFLKRHQIGGVVFLTGDRHYSEVNLQSLEERPKLLEFTSSPLQQGQSIGPLDVDHENQVWGMRGNSFGLVTIEVEQGNGRVRFEARDENNQVPVINGRKRASEWKLQELQYGNGD